MSKPSRDLVAKSLDRITGDLADFKREVYSLAIEAGEAVSLLEREPEGNAPAEKYLEMAAKLRAALAEVMLWY